MKNNTGFTFYNPGYIKIRKRIPEQSDRILTDSEIWILEDLGQKKSFNWDNVELNLLLKNVLKTFICYRLLNFSISTVWIDLDLITFLSDEGYGVKFPWDEKTTIEITLNLKSKGKRYFYTFKSLHAWALKNQISFFDSYVALKIEDIKQETKNPYHEIFFNPTYLSDEDHRKIIQWISDTENDYSHLQNNVMLHLAMELAPRASQIHTLNPNDLEKTNTPSLSESFYCLLLPMAKKNSSAQIERRPRKISDRLGQKFEKLIEYNNSLYLFGVSALFIDKDGNRLSSSEVSKIIIELLESLNLSQKIDLTKMRHHLGQTLADQGASADVIAELLGHNSTVPARAYIASTPKIAEIKTKALGKNETYMGISEMLITGEIINRNEVNKNLWVKGMVGSQYIGGIGACALPLNTACTKNPVYSCYTCPKFNPFTDGPHEEVKQHLQHQAQYFIDIAEKGGVLKNNRPVAQLETTINAVSHIIEIINNKEI